jgi:hypothetical protein
VTGTGKRRSPIERRARTSSSDVQLSSVERGPYRQTTLRFVSEQVG